jgi:hypothetical protein
MKTLTIQITDEQEKFLKEFAAKQFDGAKDNVSTRDPLHFVQTKRERVVDPDFGYADKTVYILCGDATTGYDTPQELVEAFYEDQYDECPIKIVSFDDAYANSDFTNVNGEDHCVLDEDDYFEAYGIKEEDWYSTSIEYYYEDVAFCFILDEAKRYIQYQGHNLCEPRTYTKSPGYSNNSDFVYFRDLLMAIGTQLNQEEKKDDV